MKKSQEPENSENCCNINALKQVKSNGSPFPPVKKIRWLKLNILEIKEQSYDIESHNSQMKGQSSDIKKKQN